MLASPVRGEDLTSTGTKWVPFLLVSSSATTRKPLGWKSNFGPSIVVLLISIPLSMGIAIASGVPPARGLVTAIVGGLVIAGLSGSPLQISGPSAGLAVMVLEVVQSLGLKALAVVVLLMGLIQAAAGLLRLGQVFRAVSPAVINGMLAGIGVLIFSSQFHVAVDDNVKGSGLDNLLSIPGAIQKGIFPMDGSVHHQAALIGVLTLVVLMVMGALKKTPLGKIPSALAAVGVAAVAAAVFEIPIQRVAMPGSFADALIFPDVSYLELFTDKAVLVSALTLAFVASAETLLCATAVDGMHSGERTNYDKELFAQGIGNTVCGLVGGLPTTGVITRSTANVQAGATSRASGILVGGWLLIVMVLFPTAFNVVPRASLAALLVYIGFKLVRGRPYAAMRAHGRSELAIFAITVCTIVAVNLLTGILTGLALAVIKLLLSGGKQFHRFSIERIDDGNMTHLHLRGAASFIRLPRLASALEQVEVGREVHLHIEELEYIDHACLDLLDRWEVSRIRSRSPVRVEWQTLRHRYHEKNRLDPSPALHAEAPAGDAHLLDFLTADKIVITPQFRDKWHAIDVLSAKLATVLEMPAADLVASVCEREREESTYLGEGLMMPHGVAQEGGHIDGVMAVSLEGWDFEGTGGEKVHCVVLLATPPAEASRHLAVLAAFARLFTSQTGLREQLISATDSAEARFVLSDEDGSGINYAFESRAQR